MEIVFVRHTAVDVAPGICYGKTDVGLKNTFPEEAEIVKKKIDGKFDAVFRSPLSRCKKLADACGFYNAIPDNRLIEMNFGNWEMKRYDEIDDPRLKDWFDNWQTVKATGGESFADQTKRVADWIEDMKKTGASRILAFTHAGVIMNALLITGKVSVEKLFSAQPAYGGIVSLSV